MSWRQLAAGLAIIVVIIAALGFRAILGGDQGEGVASASASQAEGSLSSSSSSVAESTDGSPSETASDEQSPTQSPTLAPTAVPTAQPTAQPTARPPTPTPQPTVMCIPEPNGWQSYFQSTVVAGQTMEITHYFMPVGQKLHLDVDYPNGQTVSIGDKVSVMVGDTPTLQWIWTVPAGMTPGTGTARWTGSCGTRSYDGDVDFTITAS